MSGQPPPYPGNQYPEDHPPQGQHSNPGMQMLNEPAYAPQQPTYGFGQPTYGNEPTNYGYTQPPMPIPLPRTDPYSNAHLGEMGGEPKVEDSTSGFGQSFTDKAVRRGFIKKVYLILFTQLLVTFGIICLFVFVKPVNHWVRNDGLWFYIVAYVLFFVLYFVLVCVPKVRRNSPGNFICLGLFTLAFSYLAATISSFHETRIVLIAAGITCIVCLAISIFAIQTKIDFTMCSGLLFVLCIVLVLFGFSCLIVYRTSGPNHIMSCVYGGLAALVFGLFLVYDTQVVVGGRKYEISPEEYIYGALQLYVDVVYLFLIILSFAGGKK